MPRSSNSAGRVAAHGEIRYRRIRSCSHRWRGTRQVTVAPHLHAQYRAMSLDPEAGGRRSCAAVHAPLQSPGFRRDSLPTSRQAWARLALALLIGSLGSVGMWSVVVVLPVVQAEFGATRGTVSLAFTMAMLGFGSGGVVTGQDHRPLRHRGRDRAQHRHPRARLMFGAGLSSTFWQFIPVHFLIGLGTSATFGPLMAEASHWFERYRGLAVTIVASGNYFGGTIWPPLVNSGMQSIRLAHHPYRDRHFLRGRRWRWLLLLLRALMGGARARNHDNAPPPRVDLRSLDQYADRAAVARQHRLLRGDVDAAGSHRRLLRRSRLRRGARRRDAVADDGVRHRSAGSARDSWPTGSAASARC